MSRWNPSVLDEHFQVFHVELSELDRILDEEAIIAEEVIADGQSGLPEIESADSLVAQDLPLPPEIIKGFLHQGLKGVLGSSSKARKTWILLDMGVAVATGGDFWRWQTTKGKVLYINFEIPKAFIRSRLKALYKCRGITSCPGLDIWNMRGYSAPLWQHIPTFVRRMIRNKYTLVIIDPIYKGLGGREENAAEDVALVCNELEEIAVETGAAVVYAAHFSKGNQAGKEAIDRISGSGVWARDADSLMIMIKHESDDCYTIETVLRNLPEQPSFVVRWQYPIMTVDDDLDPERLKKAGGRKKESDPLKFLEFIKDTTPETAISTSEWAVRAKISRTTLVGYVQEMRQMGWIATVGDGTNAKKCITEKGRSLLDGN